MSRLQKEVSIKRRKLDLFEHNFVETSESWKLRAELYNKLVPNLAAVVALQAWAWTHSD
ncbi:MAG: hypothetical protein QXR53_02365 [Candidatus Norongarragalinales archaeon]